MQLPSGQRQDYIAVAWQKEDFSLVGEAVAVVVPVGWLQQGRTGIEVNDPQLAFAKILEFLLLERGCTGNSRNRSGG